MLFNFQTPLPGVDFRLIECPRIQFTSTQSIRCIDRYNFYVKSV